MDSPRSTSGPGTCVEANGRRRGRRWRGTHTGAGAGGGAMEVLRHWGADPLGRLGLGDWGGAPERRSIRMQIGPGTCGRKALSVRPSLWAVALSGGVRGGGRTAALCARHAPLPQQHGPLRMALGPSLAPSRGDDRAKTQSSGPLVTGRGPKRP